MVPILYYISPNYSIQILPDDKQISIHDTIPEHIYIQMKDIISHRTYSINKI
jgi:hypothetical protein